MLVCNRPHTSTMDLSQAAPSSARLCHPHGNYYLVTFLRAAVGGGRTLLYRESNTTLICDFLKYIFLD